MFHLVQLTEGRSARDIPKQLPIKKIGHGDVGHLEKCLTERRITAGLQAPEVRLHRSITQQFKKKSEARPRSRSRGQSGTHVGQVDHSSRGYSQSPPTRTSILSTFEDWHWKSDSAYDAAECGMESIFGEITELEAHLGQTVVFHPSTEGHAFTSSEVRRRDVPDGREEPFDHRHSETPLFDVVPEDQKNDLEQGCPSRKSRPPEPSPTVSGSQPGWGEHLAVSCLEESTSRSESTRRNLLSMDADNHSSDASSLATSVLPQYLASCGSGCAETITHPLPSSQADREQDTPKAVRICFNPEGLFCWLNATSIGLCWLGLACGTKSTDWAISWLFDELTQFTPQPISLRFGDSTFHRMLREWAEHHQLHRQQDVADFLSFCLPQLMPAFYSADWLSVWAFDSGEMQDDHQEKGTRFGPIMCHVDDPNDDQDLQSLINFWHDATGHARTLTGCPPGLCIRLNRLMGNISPTKDLRPIDISSHVVLPCRMNDSLEWSKIGMREYRPLLAMRRDASRGSRQKKNMEQLTFDFKPMCNQQCFTTFLESQCCDSCRLHCGTFPFL